MKRSKPSQIHLRGSHVNIYQEGDRGAQMFCVTSSYFYFPTELNSYNGDGSALSPRHSWSSSRLRRHCCCSNKGQSLAQSMGWQLAPKKAMTLPCSDSHADARVPGTEMCSPFPQVTYYSPQHTHFQVYLLILDLL